MQENSELLVGLDVSKNSHVVTVAENGRDGEVRSYGEIGADVVSVRRFVHKLDRPNARVQFCHEAGLTGYGLKRPLSGRSPHSRANLQSCRCQANKTRPCGAGKWLFRTGRAACRRGS